jgi:hypothetical protein
VQTTEKDIWDSVFEEPLEPEKNFDRDESRNETAVAQTPQTPEWDKYFDDETEQLEPQSDEPIDFEPVQQDAIKSPLMRGGTVLLACAGLCGVAGLGVSALFGGQTPQEQVAARPVPKIDPNQKLVGTLKGQAVFNRQGNEDDKFKKSGKPAPTKVTGKKVPPKPTPANTYSVASSPETSYVTPVRSLPVSAVPESRPSYSAPAYMPPQPVQRQQTPRTDPNQLWSQIAQGSTMNIQGVESQTQEVAQYDATQAQNVSNWQTVEGEQAAPVPTLGKTIPMQTEITATLQIPVSASGSQQAVMTLDSPLKANGEIVLPAKTLLVASVQPDGGLMNLRINTAYLNGQELSIPGDSIMVLAANKQFLIAQSFNKKNGFGRGVRDFALGMIGGVAEQALSPSSSTTISNGFGSTTVNNVSRNLTNSLLGGARGGVNTLIQNIQAQNNNSQPESPVSGLKAGTRVRLVFTSPTNI